MRKKARSDEEKKNGKGKGEKYLAGKKLDRRGEQGRNRRKISEEMQSSFSNVGRWKAEISKNCRIGTGTFFAPQKNTVLS